MQFLHRAPVLSALVLGMLMPLGFEPFHQFWFVPVCLAALFLVFERVNLKKALASGFAFGVGAFGIGVSWVYVSLSTFGNMPPLLAAVCVMGFVALLALFPMLSAALQYLLRNKPRPVRLVLVMPAAWVIAEILRNTVMTGFSWLQSGYSQTGYALSGFAPILGVHGVSLMVSICAGLVAWVVSGRGHSRVAAGFVLLITVLLGSSLQAIEWTRPIGRPLEAALVQSVVPIQTKWDPEQAEAVTWNYLQKSQGRDVDLIIWPESALTSYLDQLGPRFYDELVKLKAPLLSGFLERQPAGRNGFNYYNSAVLFDDEVSIYRKRHLVPFGEYTPLSFLFDPLAAFFDVPMSILSSWPEPQEPMLIAGRKVAVSICYEDAFPQDIRPMAQNSDVLINLSEDAWFGRSLGPAQRMQMARMRTIETGRPMFRSSNTAYSALIDHRGEVIVQSQPFERQVIEGSLQPRTGLTPYLRFSDWPVYILIILMMAVSLTTTRSETTRRGQAPPENR